MVSGDKVKTANGQWAVFQEIETVPSTLAVCQILLAAFSLMKNAKLLQSDCVRAYVQHPMKGTKTYIRLPPGGPSTGLDASMIRSASFFRTAASELENDPSSAGPLPVA